MVIRYYPCVGSLGFLVNDQIRFCFLLRNEAGAEMIGVQKMWSLWSANNPSNNMMIRKVQREAFYAGAEMAIEHLHAVDRIAADLVQEQGGPFRVIDGGKRED